MIMLVMLMLNANTDADDEANAACFQKRHLTLKQTKKRRKKQAKRKLVPGNRKTHLARHGSIRAPKTIAFPSLLCTCTILTFSPLFLFFFFGRQDPLNSFSSRLFRIPLCMRIYINFKKGPGEGGDKCRTKKEKPQEKHFRLFFNHHHHHQPSS